MTLEDIIRMAEEADIDWQKHWDNEGNRLERFAALAFEQGRQEGMKQERALWELSKLGQEIEAQPDRQWLGLTDEEINTCDPSEECWGLLKIARAIEAKLKEKNT